MNNNNYKLLSESGNKRVNKFIDNISESIQSGRIKTRRSAVKRFENNIVSISKKHTNIYNKEIYFDVKQKIDTLFDSVGWELYSNITEFEWKIWYKIAEEIVGYDSAILNYKQEDTICSRIASYRSLAPSYFESLVNKKYTINPKNRGKYPGNWATIVNDALVRAKNRCQRCKAQNGKPYRNSRSIVKLEIAHLDHNPLNNKSSNLKALCKSCHTKHDVPLRHYIWERTIAKWWIKEGKKNAKQVFKVIKIIGDDSIQKFVS